jgi:hypothetical protein
MAKNKTIYIKDKDAKVWDEAPRMLAFYQRKGLGDFLTEKLQEYVKEENARQAQSAKSSGESV